MAFHEIRFPAALSFGSSGGVERRTDIVTLTSGHEERNSPWANSRRRYDAGLGLRSLDDLSVVLAFFEARRGRLHAFRWKDWLDHKSCAPSATPGPQDQVLAPGAVGGVYQLAKGYADIAGGYTRPIAKPVAGTVRLAVDGAAQTEGADFSVDPATGTVTFTVAPGGGALVTAGFEFDVPARFDTDVIEAGAEGFAAGEIPSIPVVEVRL